MIHSFLLIGQSNAAGRGFIDHAAPLDTCNGRLKILRNGLWLNMFRPVNPDRSFSGTSLSESFAREYAIAHPDVEVGIIPCADGGTEISQWLPGEILFDNAVNCAKLAMRTSTIKGIIWHQGEADCSEDKYPLYAEKFTQIMDAIRESLNAPTLPVLVGGLGEFLEKYESSPDIVSTFRKVNAVLEQIGNTYSNCAFVSSEGLGANPDNLHFSAEALDEFGVRYFNAFKQFDLKSDAESSETGINSVQRTAMELL